MLLYKFRYIKVTPKIRIMFKKNSNYKDVIVYTDTNLTSALDD